MTANGAYEITSSNLFSQNVNLLIRNSYARLIRKQIIAEWRKYIIAIVTAIIIRRVGRFHSKITHTSPRKEQRSITNESF